MNTLLTDHDGNPREHLATITHDLPHHRDALSGHLAGEPGEALARADEDQFESAEVEYV
ncbi:hypothetical protein ACFWAY_32155 [Rhodococcus sp. NPDC059968]|uniref:hypothetical protein n=1 Tax=Rhodococcus sp. NPDC059968 TaxID=3347017 RepID=UPI00366B20E4